MAERVAFEAGPVPEAAPGLVHGLLSGVGGHPLGPDRLVHGDLAGNVLLDPRGAPVVIDLAPYWRPVLWAEAVWVLDSVLWWGADPGEMEQWVHGAAGDAMRRAGVFRLLSDPDPDVPAYRRALAPLRRVVG